MSQHQLYALISDFSINTVIGWVSQIYKKFGPEIAGGDAVVPIIVRFAQSYYNMVARSIYSRNDEYVNEKFDEMKSIKLPGENHPIDILNIIVFLSLHMLNEMEIKNVVGRDYNNSMMAVRAHLESIAHRYIYLSAELNGCGASHVHEEIGPHDNIFTFAIDKFTEKDGQMVKLSNVML